MYIKKIRRVPIFGILFRCLNLYVGKGDPKYLIVLSPFELWLSRLIKPTFWVAVICYVLILSKYLLSKSVPDFSGLVLTAFPSLLGFGIGVFALLFVLPSSFLKGLDEKKKESGFGSTILIADMAYPLTFLTFALAASPVISAFGQGWVEQFFHLFIFLYGLELVLELIGAISSTAIKLFLNDDSESKTPE